VQWVSAAFRIAASLWAGGLWVIGYLVAPTLFALLDDRKLAGEIAGWMFSRVGWLGLACALLMLLAIASLRSRASMPRWLLPVVLAMSALSALQLFYLQPTMHAIKLAGGQSFGLWHGISSALYLLQSLLAAGPVLAAPRRAAC